MTADLKALELFNEKAEKLRGGRFAQRVFGTPSGVKLTMDGATLTATRTGPDQDAIDAATLTFRFFIQDNEACSFRNLSKLYPQLNVPTHLSTNFLDARKKMNDFLDSPTMINATYNGHTYSRREVFETFVYGALAHANQEKAATHTQWLENGPLYVLLENEFVTTLAQLMDVIWYIQVLNSDAIAGLGG